MPGTMKNKPAKCCCNTCPDCTAPDLESTGSTSANSAWYLIPDDATNVTYQDRASFHAIVANNCIDGSFIGPAANWAKFRVYFAYADDSNCAYVELWGHFVYPSTVVWTIDICICVDGVETVLVAHSVTTSAVSAGVAVTYDEATGEARVVAIIPWVGSGVSKWRSYDLVDLNTSYYSYSQDLGIRYGWGRGEITGSAAGFSDATVSGNLRHIDYCQGFPHFTADGPSLSYHPWIKSSVLAAETILIDADGISSCSACNDQQTLYHPSEVSFAGNQSTFDMLTDEIETGWTGTLPIGLGGYSIDWLLSFRFDAGWAFGRMTVRVSVVGRYRYTVGGTVYYGLPYALAYQDFLFAGTCDPYPEYDARDAIDGLVCDKFILYDFGSWTTHGVPDLSGVSAVLSLP